MGVPVTGTITTTDPADSYATVDPLTGIDGWRSVADHAARNAIPALRRRPGMAVYTRSDGLLWVLTSDPGAGTDADWTQFTGGGGSGTVTSVGLTVPAGLSVSGSPVTGSGTLAIATALAGIVNGTGSGLGTVAIGGGLAYDGTTLSAVTTGGLVAKSSVMAATTATLAATYANGAGGVGATLTNAGAPAAFAVDGYSAGLDDRILVKGQGTASQDGLYTVTTVGSGSVAWVLTRATDYDQPSEIAAGDYVVVAKGTANAGTLWVQVTTGTITVGTSAIAWLELAVAPLLVTLAGDTSGAGAGTINTATTRVNGVSYPASPGLNTVPVVTGANAVTYQALPNAALANPSLTIAAGTGLSGGGAVALGGSVTVSLSTPVAVGDGGTGVTSLTPYAVVCGGTTSAGAVQPLASVGASGQVLTSNGAGAPPSWQAPAGGSGTVTSVGLTMPGGLSVSGSPVTGSGTLAVTTSLSGIIQASGGAFSTIAVGAGLTFSGGVLSASTAGTVTSVGLSLPGIFSASGSPITTAGTIGVTLVNQSANAVLAGPSSGAAGTPSFRALVPADYPAFVASGASHAAGAVPDPGGTAGTTRYLREDATWATPPGGSGTVTSVGLSMPPIFSVLGSPVTGGGTISVSLANQVPNLVLASPATNPAAAPTFRALAAADLPTTGLQIKSHYGGDPPGVTASAGAASADLSQSDWWIVNLSHSATTTIGLANVSPGQQFVIRLVQDGTGSNLVTWFSGIKWPGGTVPTLSTAAGAIDVFTFKRISSGNYDGFTPGQAMA